MKVNYVWIAPKPLDLIMSVNGLQVELEKVNTVDYDVILVDFDGTLFDTIPAYNKFWAEQSLYEPDFHNKSTIQILSLTRYNTDGARAAMNHGLKPRLHQARPIWPIVEFYKQNHQKCFIFSDSMAENITWSFYSRRALSGLPMRFFACDCFSLDGLVFKWHEHRLKRDKWRWEQIDKLLKPKKVLLIDDSQYVRDIALRRGIDVVDSAEYTFLSLP